MNGVVENRVATIWRRIARSQTMTLRNSLIAATIVTATAVFFNYQMNVYQHANASSTNDVDSLNSDELTSVKASGINLDIVHKDASKSSQKSTKANTQSNNANSNTSTTVNIDGSTTRLEGDQTYHKVVKSKDGSTSVTIRSSSKSHGDNESSLTLDLDYSSETEVNRDSSSSE